MQDMVRQLIELLEYTGIFGLMAVFSTELVMPFAGFLAWHGTMSLSGVIVAGTFGSAIGSVVLYYLTRFVPHERIYHFADNHGAWLGVSGRTIRRTEAWFDRHARASVFLGKFLPGVRSAVSLIAGYRHMPPGQFMFFSFLGTAISTAAMAALGYFVSRYYETAQAAAIYVSNAVLFIVAACLVSYAIYRHRKYGR
jgi:membrane protein DedA with SNARE-associated domain